MKSGGFLRRFWTVSLLEPEPGVDQVEHADAQQPDGAPPLRSALYAPSLSTERQGRRTPKVHTQGAHPGCTRRGARRGARRGEGGDLGGGGRRSSNSWQTRRNSGRGL